MYSTFDAIQVRVDKAKGQKACIKHYILFNNERTYY